MDGFMRIVFVVDAASESVSPGTVQQIVKGILRGARQSQSLPVKYGFASSLLGPLCDFPPDRCHVFLQD